MSSKRDYYEVLGVSRTAVQAIRVGLYRLSCLMIAGTTAESVDRANVSQNDANGSRCRREWGESYP